MSLKTRRLYEFSEFRLDPAERTLTRGGAIVPLKAKVFDLLVLLAQNPGTLLEKEWLLEQLWPDSHVEEVNLNVNVSTLRKALGETPANPQFIETVPKRGYRFVAQVREYMSVAASAGSGEMAGEEIPTQRAEATRPATGATGQPLTVFPSTAHERFTAENPATAATGTRLSSRRLALLGLLVALTLGAVAYWFVTTSRRAVTGETPRTIAVLPFKTTSDDEAEKALGVGMANELIRRLNALQQLTVRPTNSVLKYAEAGSDPVAAGRELGVEVVLDGLVQRFEKQVRVSAQMLRVADGAVLWSVRFDDFFTNVFAVQDSISEKMTDALALRLTTEERRRMTRRQTENTEAYQLFLLGQYLINKPSHNWQKALEYFQEALARDPEYAPAYAGQAEVYYTMGEQGASRREMRAKAREAIETALRLDPNLAGAYATRSLLRLSEDFDWAGAEEDARRAAELTPNSADVRTMCARMHSKLGRHDDAMQEIRLALQADPTYLPANSTYAEILRDARRYDEAIAQAKKLLELDAASTTAHRLLGMSYSLASRFDEAFAALEKDVDSTGKPRLTSALIYTLARAGRRAEAENLLRQYRQQVGKPGFAGNYHGLAMIYVALGDKDRAFEALEKSYEEREYPLLHVKSSPLWDSLHGDARFADLLRRMKLEP